MQKEFTKESKSAAPVYSKPEREQARANGKSSSVRYASDEQFAKAHRKTSALHAGLFRRLAK
jgi:hypothetical protein